MWMIMLAKKICDGTIVSFIQLDLIFFQSHQTELGNSELKPKEQRGKEKLSLLSTSIWYDSLSTLPGRCSRRLKQKPLSYTAWARQLLVLKNQNMWD